MPAVVRFIQTAHHEGDDRVTYHQMPALRKAGYDVAWTEEACDYAICDTPKAVLKARKARAKTIIYDVTEWYPSKKNLRGKTWSKIPWAIAMTALNLVAGCVADRFIFGEEDKARPFRRLFPWKRYAYLPYYPSQAYICERETRSTQGTQGAHDAQSARDISKECHIFYAGPFTEEKGYNRVLEVLGKVKEMRPNVKFVAETINPAEKYLPLPEFCKELRKADIALDLRDRDAENRRCLPIKWFYYAASGVPSVYSDLDAIRKQIPNATEACCLVKTVEEAVKAILNWVDHPDMYEQARARGMELYKEKYNWEGIEENLLELIKDK